MNTGMKKLLLIYNPFSGDKSFKYDLDAYLQGFQLCGYEVHPFRTIREGDIDEHISRVSRRQYDAVAVSGGDGSIQIVVNAMMKYGVQAPLCIIPSGTANDFATFLKLPREAEQVTEMIRQGRTIQADLGLVNGCHYFINVCAAGLFTNISQQIDTDFKNVLGKLAYYVEGLGQLPSFEPVSVRITNSVETIEETLYFYMVLNSAGTGGFERLSPGAAIDDGVFDFIAVKARNKMDLAVLLVKILSGDFLEDSAVIFFRDSYVKVETLTDDADGSMSSSSGENSAFNETTLDGEAGPPMPVEIQNVPAAIKIFIP